MILRFKFSVYFIQALNSHRNKLFRFRSKVEFIQVINKIEKKSDFFKLQKCTNVVNQN